MSLSARATFVLLALSLGLEGCTLVGMGVGAGVDSMVPGPYDERPPEEVRPARGDRILVATCSERLEGRYAGVFAPTARDPESYLLLEQGDALVRVPESEIRAVGVEVPGKGWLYGGVAGLAVDVAVVVAAAIAVHDMDFSGMDLSGGTGCFC